MLCCNETHILDLGADVGCDQNWFVDRTRKLDLDWVGLRGLARSEWQFVAAEVRILNQDCFLLALLVHGHAGVGQSSDFGSDVTQLIVQDISFGVDLQVDLPLDDIWFKPVCVGREFPVDLYEVQLALDAPVDSLDVVGEHVPCGDARLGVEGEGTRREFDHVDAEHLALELAGLDAVDPGHVGKHAREVVAALEDLHLGDELAQAQVLLGLLVLLFGLLLGHDALGAEDFELERGVHAAQDVDY